MVVSTKLPAALAANAQRRTWYERGEAEKILDWIEDTGQRFLGLDVAQKNDDESWTLLLDTLDLSNQTENFEAVRRGRVFLSEHDGEGRMFEPVWQDRQQ
ncbi:MAG: hypothetical protein ACM308_07595 [Qipengyuania vulgaris]